MNSYALIKGYVFALIFCLTVAFSSILIHQTNQLISPYLSVFLTFSICVVWFNLINWNSFGFIYKQINQNKKNVFIINLVTAINWITTFEALKYIDPILYISIFMGLMPVATYLINSIKQRQKMDFITLFICLAIVMILAMIVIVSKEYSTLNIVYFTKGLCLTVISSIASAVYMLYSKETETSLKLSASQIVGIRFYLLIGYAGFVCLQQHHFTAIGNIYYLNFLLLAVVSSILPMYCIQKSISYIGGVKASFVIPFTPVFTYLLLWILHGQMSKLMLMLLIGLAFVLFYHSFTSFKRVKNNKLPIEAVE